MFQFLAMEVEAQVTQTLVKSLRLVSGCEERLIVIFLPPAGGDGEPD